MQLAEQGKLDLNGDVNAYLDFHIPDTYSQPITLRHLMTHTAGFEDQHADMVTLNEEDIVPQGKWLVSHIPARVFPPGEIPAYSNYGAALAGCIIGWVSGQSYSEYIQEHILDPLGMKNSTLKVYGELDDSWLDWFGEAKVHSEVSADENQITAFSNAIMDQAALVGLIRRLHRLGIVIISIRQV